MSRNDKQSPESVKFPLEEKERQIKSETLKHVSCSEEFQGISFFFFFFFFLYLTNTETNKGVHVISSD